MILFCRCARADVLPAPARQQAERSLRGSPEEWLAVDDLCGLAARRDPLLGRAAASRRLTVAACHPRAVRWLFHAAGFPLVMEKVRWVDLRADDADRIAAGLSDGLGGAAPAPGQAGESNVPSDDGWIPWFPVIDYERCAHCGQCRNFCLFGVYDADAEGKVHVSNPRHCKTNCPACARLCPQVAIMFPKYGEGPISGLEVRPEDLSRPDLRVDPSRFGRGDVRAALRGRAAQR